MYVSNLSVTYLSVVFVFHQMASKPFPLSGHVLHSSKFTHHIPQSCSAQPLRYKTWTSENLEWTCQAIESGLSLKQGAEEYHLTDEEEEELVTFLLETGK